MLILRGDHRHGRGQVHGQEQVANGGNENINCNLKYYSSNRTTNSTSRHTPQLQRWKNNTKHFSINTREYHCVVFWDTQRALRRTAFSRKEQRLTF